MKETPAKQIFKTRLYAKKIYKSSYPSNSGINFAEIITANIHKIQKQIYKVTEKTVATPLNLLVQTYSLHGVENWAEFLFYLLVHACPELCSERKKKF